MQFLFFSLSTQTFHNLTTPQEATRGSLQKPREQAGAASYPITRTWHIK